MACYFATLSDDDQDAAIWTFNNEELLKNNRESRLSRDYAPFRELTGAKTIEDWALAALDAGPYIEVFRYQYANPQMSAQQSLFTVSGQLGDDHDVALGRSLPETWQTLKIVISKSDKKKLRQRLFKMNVSALALFPTLDGVGRNIRETIECELPLDDEGLLWVLDEKARRKRKRRQS